MKHWKPIMVVVLMALILLAPMIKSTTTQPEPFQYRLRFDDKYGNQYTMDLPNTQLETVEGQTDFFNGTNEIIGAFKQKTYRVKGDITVWFSDDSTWTDCYSTAYFNLRGIEALNAPGIEAPFHHHYSNNENRYDFIIPAGQKATLTYYAGRYLSKPLGVITNKWGVYGRCNINLYLDSQGPNQPKGLRFNTANTTDVINIDGTYYSLGNATLLWETPSDLPGNSVEASGIQGYKIYDNENQLIPEDGNKYFYGNSKNLSLTGEGLHKIKIEAYDKEDNPGEFNEIYIYVDHTPPILTDITKWIINNNNPYTKDPIVSLSLSGLSDGPNRSGLSEVGFSYDNVNYDWCSIGNIPSTLTLPSETDGTKTIYLKLKDKLGNISPNPITKTITLDRAAPTGSIFINGGASTTYAQDVTLTLAATDTYSGILKMRFCNDSNIAANYTVDSDYSSEYPWTLSDNNEAGTNKAKTVYVIFTDGAGNDSKAIEIKATIVYEDHPHFTDPTPVNILAEDETWSADRTIIGQLVVPVGKKLTISPGVTITFDSPADKNTDPELNGLIIQGELEVQSGTTGVSFKKTADKPGWMGIIISGAAAINGADISWAKRGVAVLSGASGVSINGCEFSQNFIGVHAYGSAPRIDNCTFVSNKYGIKEDDGGAPVVTGCVYTGNIVDYYDEILTKR